jgi:transposase
MESTAASVAVSNLDHLGLVAGMIDTLCLVEVIDSLLPSEHRVSHGVVVKALLLNAIGFSQHALYLTPSFFERCPVGHLLGSEYCAADFNDDRLGRTLDALFEYGLSSLFVQLSSKACANQGIDTSFYHVDSTNFSVEGAYNVEEDDAVKIRHGFAKDKRNDLKQVTLGLITTYKTAIPRYMQNFDGNASDKQTLVTMINKFIACFREGEDVGIFISDAGIYSEENISEGLQNVSWITRVPGTIKECKDWIANTKDADLQDFSTIPGYRYRAVASAYGGVAQRWLIIQSAPLASAITHTQTANANKQQAAFERKIQQQQARKTQPYFLSVADLDAWLEALALKYPLVSLNYTIEEGSYYVKAGKPKEEHRRTSYKIGHVELSTNTVAIAAIAVEKSRFILASNVLDTDKLSDEALLSAYKSQATSVENGFKFLKDPIFFAESFFVKKPSRLESLLFLMSLSLLVYALCERKLRAALASENQTITAQNAKQTAKPTMRLVFNLFRGIHVVTLKPDTQPFCTNLNPNHIKIINLLGPTFAKYYFLRI